jgi:hypothetical protein
MVTIKSSRRGLLTSYREVGCPTCGAKAGEYCKATGLRGSTVGAPMPTVIHTARKLDSSPLSQTAKTEHNNRRKGALKAWRTRRAKAKIDAGFFPNYSTSAAPAPLEAPAPVQPSLTIGKLFSATFDILETGANSCTLSLDHVGTVYGHREGDRFLFTITKA